MVGLDAAGKTSTLYRPRLGDEALRTMPTSGFNVETVRHKNLSFTIWDMGGGDKLHALNFQYCQMSRAIIYVVDSADVLVRFDYSRYELFDLLGHEESRDLPLLVLANKQDLPNAVTPTEVAEKLGLNEIKDRQGASAARGEGLYEGLDWIVRQLNSRIDGQRPV